jgi:hypothetical protein
MTTLPQEAFTEILQELQSRPLPVNKYRDKAGSGRSQTFGLVNRRCLPVDYSRQNWIRPKLFYHLQEFARQYVDVSWTSITVNQNYRAGPHRDKGNYGISYLVAWGSYTGGDLQILEGDLSGSHNIYCRPIKTDFSKVLHSVQDFTGERYSLVFYNLKSTKMPKEPLPKGEAVFEGGKYLFKRGGKTVTAKEGLEHPLRGKKKQEPMTVVVSQESFTVTFD